MLGRNSQNKPNGFSIHGVQRSGVEINRLLRTSYITQKWSWKRYSPTIVVRASSRTELLIGQVSSKTKNGDVLREQNTAEMWKVWLPVLIFYYYCWSLFKVTVYSKRPIVDKPTLETKIKHESSRVCPFPYPLHSINDDKTVFICTRSSSKSWTEWNSIFSCW